MSFILGISCFALGMAVSNSLWIIKYMKLQEELQDILYNKS